MISLILYISYFYRRILYVSTFYRSFDCGVLPTYHEGKRASPRRQPEDRSAKAQERTEAHNDKGQVNPYKRKENQYPYLGRVGEQLDSCIDK